jgi:hypothetical protein
MPRDGRYGAVTRLALSEDEMLAVGHAQDVVATYRRSFSACEKAVVVLEKMETKAKPGEVPGEQTAGAGDDFEEEDVDSGHRIGALDAEDKFDSETILFDEDELQDFALVIADPELDFYRVDFEFESEGNAEELSDMQIDGALDAGSRSDTASSTKRIIYSLDTDDEEEIAESAAIGGGSSSGLSSTPARAQFARAANSTSPSSTKVIDVKKRR